MLFGKASRIFTYPKLRSDPCFCPSRLMCRILQLDDGTILVPFLSVRDDTRPHHRPFRQHAGQHQIQRRLADATRFPRRSRPSATCGDQGRDRCRIHHRGQPLARFIIGAGQANPGGEVRSLARRLLRRASGAGAGRRITRFALAPPSGFAADMEKFTGLTGAAFVAYIVIFESTFFSPINLVPVP